MFKTILRPLNKSSATPNAPNAMQAIQELYIKQRQGRKSDFRGKEKQIEAQYAEFWQQPHAKKDVDAFRERTPNHQFASIQRGLQEDTVLTNPSPESILAENDECRIVCNLASFDVAQYVNQPRTASMSFIHILGVPKACLYNGVSLNCDDVVILDRIIQLFEDSWRKDEFRERVLKHQEQAIERRYNSIKNRSNADEEGYDQALKHFEEPRKLIPLNKGNFGFGLHLYPNHSISQLHVHIIATSKKMRQYSTTEYDAKTTDAGEVRDFISKQPLRSNLER